MSHSVGPGVGTLPNNQAPPRTGEQPGDPPETLAQIRVTRTAAMGRSVEFVRGRVGVRFFTANTARPSLIVQSDKVKTPVDGDVRALQYSLFDAASAVAAEMPGDANIHYGGPPLPRHGPITFRDARLRTAESWSQTDSMGA